MMLNSSTTTLNKFIQVSCGESCTHLKMYCLYLHPVLLNSKQRNHKHSFPLSERLNKETMSKDRKMTGWRTRRKGSTQTKRIRPMRRNRNPRGLRVMGATKLCMCLTISSNKTASCRRSNPGDISLDR